jgi:hypothetical protein
VTTVKTDDAGVETVRIEIIVENELKNPHSVPTAPSKQERTAFAAIVSAALPQAGQQPAP